MRTLAAILAIAFFAAPALADCQRSPFTGLVICGETAGMFQNEEVPTYQRRTQTVCDSRREWNGDITTTCHEE